MTEKIGLIAIFDTQQFNKGLNDYIKGVGEATGATEKAEKQGFSLTRALEVGVGVALEKVGEIAIATAGKLVDIGAESVSLASEFQTSMVSLQTAAADSGLSLDQLSELTLKVGADSNVLGASATGAADAMLNLYRAGLKDNAIFGDMQGYLAGTADLGGVLKASFDLAAASELDVAQASELGVVAMSVFGRELKTDAEKGQFAADALDYLVKTANASNASVSDLSEALKYAGPDAANFGMSIEDTNLALALLSNAGLKGSMAGTTLSAVMRDLTKGTDASDAALKKLGVSIYDADGATRPFVNILGDLEVALQDKTEAEKAAYLGDIFTAQGMRGINTLLGEGTTGWNNMGDAIESATGLQAQAEAQSKTYAGQMEALDGQIETLKIQFGMALIPALTSFLQTIMPIIEQAMPMFEQAFNFVSDAAQKLAYGFQALSEGNTLGFFGNLSSIIGDVFGPTVQKVFNDIVNFIYTNWPVAMEFLQTAWSEAVTFIGGLVESFKTFFATIQPLIESVVNYVIAVIGALRDNFGIIWEGIKSIVQGAVDFITNLISAFFLSTQGNTDAALAALLVAFTGAWELIKGVVETALGLILTLAGTNLTELTTTVSQLLVIIGVTWETFWTNTVNTATVAWESLLAGLAIFVNGIKTGFNNFINNMTVAWESFKAMIAEKINAMETAITTGWENIKTAISTKIQEIKDFISAIDLGYLGKALIDGFIGGITNGLASIGQVVKDGVRNAINAAKNELGISSPSKVFAEIGINTMKGLAIGIDSSSMLPQQAMQNSVGGLMQSPVSTTTNNINNSRNINLQINNTNQTANNTYFDVVAGLQAVGI